MKERRAEVRMWCSELIHVRLEGTRSEDLIANLEDISPSGACVQFEHPVPAGTPIALKLGRRKLRGEVKYCTHNEVGYFAGIQFAPGHKWSREIYEPEHLLDPTRVRARKR
jgi:PilZ domain